jgi:hypothetical protein
MKGGTGAAVRDVIAGHTRSHDVLHGPDYVARDIERAMQRMYPAERLCSGVVPCAWRGLCHVGVCVVIRPRLGEMAI